MPRLTPITKREQVSGDALIAFDAIIESRGSINGPQSMQMYAPGVARWSTVLNDALRFDAVLSDHDTELAIITDAREMDCEYVWASHAVAALKAGVRQEAIDIVANDKSLDGLTKEEAVIVRYGREVMGAQAISGSIRRGVESIRRSDDHRPWRAYGLLSDDRLYLDRHRYETRRRHARSA